MRAAAWRRLGTVAFVATCGTAAACGGATRGEPDAAGTNRVQSTHSRAAASPESNVLFSDYAGSEACAPCHADVVEKWRRSPMHNMTRAASTAETRSPFAGETFAFKGDTIKLSRAGANRFFEMSHEGGHARVFELTRVIGGRTREDYAAIEVDAVKPNARPLGEASTEWVMPVSFVFHTKSLRYKGYSVMLKERPYLREGPEWNKTCIFCHNTAPYFDTALGAFAGRKVGFQGEVVDPILPAEKRFLYRVTNTGAFDDALRAEAQRLGVDLTHTSKDGAPLLEQTVEAVRESFRAPSLVEVGIGCEACHYGARAHAEHPSDKPALWPKSPAIAIGPRDGSPPSHAEAVNRTCARCHQVLFSHYPYTWEGKQRLHGVPGGSNINSGEARDLLLGHCASKLACTNCHDPHAFDHAQQNAETEQKDVVCTQCHAKYADVSKVAAHTHHAPESAGSRCVACHMPKKNLSLDGKLTRYHRIASPNEMEKVLLDRPLECALCHADKSVRELTQKMTEWWKRPYDAQVLESLYGSLDANVMRATAERGKPHEQAVALYILGDTKTRAGAAVAGRALTHEYPIVRFYAKDAIGKMAGADFAIDLDADDAEVERTRQSFFAAHGL
jgi:hypothetical protein